MGKISDPERGGIGIDGAITKAGRTEGERLSNRGNLAHKNRLYLISVSDCDAVTAEY